MTKEPTDPAYSEMGDAEKTERIRDANDALRRHFIGGRVMLTIGVDGLENTVKTRVVQAIADFDDFSEDNDPYGEHDFGAVDIEGEKYFFKIDAYDKNLEYGSPEPADPDVTTRVMTIMRADEY